MPMAELITGFFLIVGGVFLLVGSIGLFRLPDFYMRLHGPTKASTLGIGAILMASIVFFSFKEGGISIKEFLIILFIFLSAPITANMLAKAALHVRRKPRGDTLNHDRLEAIRERKH
ncbi:MrpG: Na(+)/H(+) antiporter, subunit G (Multiple resistance and pH homeostasis protein G) [Desulfosarcina variabilis str. Montpellier]|uniref:Na+/H+ antiporter subunit G n=1 Tax=Desulfosarcina variabilis TaxID=2300 RepID=UPI003AFA20ED